MAAIDGKQIANMLYHAGRSTNSPHCWILRTRQETPEKTSTESGF